MKQPILVSMAIQERGTKGLYTAFHWRLKLKKFLKTVPGNIFYKSLGKEDKEYIKTMLKEIKK